MRDLIAAAAVCLLLAGCQRAGDVEESPGPAPGHIRWNPHRTVTAPSPATCADHEACRRRMQEHLDAVSRMVEELRRGNRALVRAIEAMEDGR